MKKYLIIGLFSLLSVAICIPEANAQSAADIGQMFASGTSSFVAVTKLIKYTSYLIGLFLILGSIFKFSQLGSNQQLTAKTPIVMFCVGIAIFALTGSINVVGQTLSMGNGPGNILMPVETGGSAAMSAAMTGVLTFIRLIGYIAFIRGWLMLNSAGGTQAKDGIIGKGLTHLAGGVACINIGITAKILANTFAPGIPLSVLGL